MVERVAGIGDWARRRRVALGEAMVERAAGTGGWALELQTAPLLDGNIRGEIGEQKSGRMVYVGRMTGRVG